MRDLPPRHGEPPQGYPVAYERWLRLGDGRTVWVRPVLPSDGPELAEAIRTADAETLYRRFLGAPPSVTPALLTWLTTVDYVRRFAPVALDPATKRGIAIARYEPLEEGVAEIAAAVDPAWRRVGLATRDLSGHNTPTRTWPLLPPLLTTPILNNRSSTRPSSSRRQAKSPTTMRKAPTT